MHCQHCLTKCKSKFCCKGCEAAHKLIEKLNLVKYYEYCKSIYGKSPMKVQTHENHLNYKNFIISNKESHKINLLIDGIHCGSCIWLIENSLKKQNGVINARLNLSTKRLVLEWNTDIDKINDLINLIEQLGYKPTPYNEIISETQNKENEHNLLRRMVIAGFASMSIMMISIGVWAGNYDETLGENVRNYLHIISTIIAVPAAIYSSQPFLNSAFSAIKSRRSNMDVPISIAIIVSCLISIQQTILGGLYTYYDAALSLVFFLLIGRFLDLKTRNKAREMAQTIILSQANSVTLLEDGKLKLYDISRAKPGDIAFIAAGEKVPVDGKIIEGVSEVDNSLITGETMPVGVKKGDQVIAGTINLNNPIKVKILKIGDSTLLSQIINLIEIAEQGKAKYVRIADKIASYYTSVVLTLSSITLLAWMNLGATFNDALLNAVTVMIITCPCALGLAVPVVQVVASSRLIKQGILIKTPDALEKLSEITNIVFDKTGTLTHGKPKWINKSDFSLSDISLISSIAASSKHPLAKAVHDPDLKMRNLNTKEVKGKGLRAEQGTKLYLLGSRKFCSVEGEDKDDKLELWFLKPGKKPTRLIFEDSLKEDAKNIIYWFNNKKIKTSILSGDRKYVVSGLSTKLGIQNYKSEVSPIDKYNFLKELSEKGEKTLMVGDGLNDSAALKAAHVSISPSTALDISQTSSDIVIQGDKLQPIQESYNVAVKANKLVIQNFILSIAYNIITIPIAMSGMANPVIAAIAMSLSSIMVVGNSLRLSKGE